MKKNTGIIRIIKAINYSYQGLKAAWKHEAAFRQECMLLIAAVILAFMFDTTVFERLLLIGSVVFVIIIELLNSAIESIVDRIGIEHHELSGRAKDLGSAAVLIALLLTLLIWTTILIF